jgi:hypothetical protein
VAKVTDLYFQAYLAVLPAGGGFPDKSFIDATSAVGISDEWRQELLSAVVNALDRVVGWDVKFSGYPTLTSAPPLFVDSFDPIEDSSRISIMEAIINSARTGIVNGIIANNPDAVSQPIKDFWGEYPDYRPMHTGRCYPHGHPQVKNLTDTVKCQLYELKAIVRWIMAGETDLITLTPSPS